MQKFFRYFLFALCLANLASVALYRLRLNSQIKSQFQDIRSAIANYEYNIFLDLTNQVSFALSSMSNQVWQTVLSQTEKVSSSQVIGSLGSDKSVLPGLLDERKPHTRLDYRFYIASGRPWVSLFDEDYTIGDEILGYGVIANCSRVAIRLDNGDLIYNSCNPTSSGNQVKVAKND